MNEKVLEQSQKRSSVEEYIAAERRNATKNEFLNGRILPRSGSNRSHNILVANSAIAVGSKMHGHKCEIYISNMRVKLAGNYVCYPDVVIVNGEPKFVDHNFDLLQNPTVVIEIFSNQTNSSDKTTKLENFLAMESVRECLLLKEDEMRVEHYARQNAKQWIYRIYNEREDVIALESINCKVSLAEIYANVKFGHTEFSSRAANSKV